MIDILKVVFGILMLSAGSIVTDDAFGAEVENKYRATVEGSKMILEPVTVTSTSNLVIIYDRNQIKPKAVIVGPKLIKTNGTVLADGSVLM